MNAPLAAFADELTFLVKTAGAGKKAVNVLMNNKMKAVGVGFIAVPTAMAFRKGERIGRAMGKPARYLKASRYGPSRALYTNYNRMITRKKYSKRLIRKLHENYRRRTYRN